MAEHWDEFDGALQDAAAGLLRAAEGLQQAIVADHRLRETSKKAREEHEDLRETVARLERLVLELLKQNRNGGANSGRL